MPELRGAFRLRACIPVDLGGDRISCVAGDVRFDLRADSIMPHIDIEGGDVVSEELANVLEVSQSSRTYRQVGLGRTALLSQLDRIYVRAHELDVDRRPTSVVLDPPGPESAAATTPPLCYRCALTRSGEVDCQSPGVGSSVWGGRRRLSVVR